MHTVRTMHQHGQIPKFYTTLNDSDMHNKQTHTVSYWQKAQVAHTACAEYEYVQTYHEKNWPQIC